jgi:ubiquinone/menaquinone biosynthesis C-methylase UbiE
MSVITNAQFPDAKVLATCAAENKKRDVLDVGCGTRKLPGAVGIDWIGGTAADVVHNLTQFPWPFPDRSFDHFYADNVMEHLPNVVATMEEIHRLGRSGATVHIKTPHYASQASWRDPTHVHHFSLESCDYFCESARPVQHYTKSRFRMVTKKLHFGGHPLSQLGRFCCWLNAVKYERRWSFIFRPSTLGFHMQVIK